MAKTDTVRELAAPIVDAAGARIYDVTFNAGKLVVSVTRPDGIDLDALADISREIGAVLDAEDPIHGSYTLEVSSPGLERTLRTPDHFVGAVGSDVTIRTRPDVDGDRRVRGVLVEVDPERASITVDVEDGGGQRVVAIDDIERARTVFTWGNTEKPGGPKKQSSKKKPGKKPGKKNPGKKNPGTNADRTPSQKRARS